MAKMMMAMAILIATAILIIGCSAEPEPEGVFIPFTPTATAIPDTELVRALKATAVAEVAATHTPAPTYTPVPTYTPQPTVTPLPTATITPTPTKTPLPANVPTPNAALDSAAKYFLDKYGVDGWFHGAFEPSEVINLAGLEETRGFEIEVKSRLEHWAYNHCESADAPGNLGGLERSDYPVLVKRQGGNWTALLYSLTEKSVQDEIDNTGYWKSDHPPHLWVLTCE